MTLIDNDIESAEAAALLPAPDGEIEETFHTREITTIGVSHGLNDMFFAFVPPLQPLLMEKMALSNAQAGLFTLFLQGPSLFQPFIGHLADRRNLRWGFILAPTLSAAMLTLLGLAPNYGILALLMLIAGFSTAVFHSIAPVLAAARSGKKIGRGMGFFMVFGELGYGLGPLVLVSLVGVLGLNGLPWLVTLGLLCSTLLYFTFKNLSTVRPMQSETPVPVREALKSMQPIMLPILAYIFITSFVYANIVNFLPTFLKGEGASFFFAGSAFSIVEMAGTVGVFASGWISDRIGQRLIILASTLTTAVFSLVFLGVQGWLQIPVLVCLGFLAFSANPAFLSIMQHHFPANRSLANGVYMAAGFVVRSIVVFLVGLLADHFGLRSVFTVSAWATFLALPFVFLLPKK
jgi:MFS transporter, FSR family, fosmidomycin resistance protein